jgi:glycosyltransferase involved in cell wall biosynthesis
MARIDRPTILHYTGYTQIQGGVHALLKTLGGAPNSRMILGVSRQLPHTNTMGIRLWRGPRMAGESINLANLCWSSLVAWRIRRWLLRGVGRYFHGHSRTGLLVGLWLTFLNVPNVIVSVHVYGRHRWFYRWAARRLGSRLYWLSPAMRNYYGVPGQGWDQCVPGCVCPNPNQRDLPTSPVLRLGGVGTIQHLKRWDLVLAAMALLDSEGVSQLSFSHIGGGEPAILKRLERQIQLKGLAGRVDFRGEESTSTNLLSQIDVLIVASDHEALSIAMLEALAAGVPVIAADSGGAVDVIEPPMNGELFKSGDAHSLAQVLKMWVRKRPRMDTASIRASAFYRDDIAAQWQAIYQRHYRGPHAARK